MADNCKHDHHLTTSNGAVMGQQNRDGSGWELCSHGLTDKGDDVSVQETTE